MAKKGQKFNEYTAEFRHKVVMEKIKEGTSYSQLGRKYNMSWKTIDSWVRKYKRQGHLEKQK